jgi:hypothetical protein
MLPHGTRCAAAPRATRQPRWASQPATVSAAPAHPTQAAPPRDPAVPSPAGPPVGTGSGGEEAPTAAPTSSRWRTATRATSPRSPNAYSAA